MGQGGGGGAGGILSFLSESLTPNTTYAVVVGAGGPGGTSGNGFGLNGGKSSFGNLTTVIGGGGGALIGPVHRVAARLDECFDIVAGALSALGLDNVSTAGRRA
jgi:hypothetical protein